MFQKVRVLKIFGDDDCGDWFHMPYKFCKCDEDEQVDLVVEGYVTEQADPDDNYSKDGGST